MRGHFTEHQAGGLQECPVPEDGQATQAGDTAGSCGPAGGHRGREVAVKKACSLPGRSPVGATFAVSAAVQQPPEMLLFGKLGEGKARGNSSYCF